MQGELREKVVSLVKRTDAEITCDSVMRYGTRIVGAEATADAILALLRDALLSDEVVEAGARGLWRNYYDHQNTGWDQEEQYAHWDDENERKVFLDEAQAALSAALAKIGAPNVAR